MTTPRVGPAYLALFAALYAVQGIVIAYLLNYNKGFMIAAGVAPRLVAWVQSAVLATLVGKFLLGPLSDRWSPFGWGHRRPFIATGLVLQAAGLAGLAAVDPGRHLAAFAALALVAVVGLALYDTCCDGMVIDVTPHPDRARVQGMLQVARFLATMVATLGFGRWIERTGLGPGRSGGVVLLCGALGLVPLALAFSLRDPGPPRGAEAFRWGALRAVARPRALVLLLFGASYASIGLGVEFNLPLFYARLGLGQGDVGLLGAARYLGRAAGALLLPVVARRVGRGGQVALGLSALASTSAGQAEVGGPGSAAAWALAFGAASGWLDALFCVLAMEAADPRMAASTFAVFMAVSNLSVAGDALFAEALARAGGSYRPVFLGAGLLAVVLFALVRPLSKPVPIDADA